MSSYEIVGVLFGLLSVYLTVRENIWLWPVGIVSCIAFAVLFWQIQLFVDFGLQIFFIAASFQGWWFWLHGGRDRKEPPITTLNPGQRIMLLIAAPLCVVVIALLLRRFSPSSVPFWDSAANAPQVLAQVLLMQKKLENWYLWIIADVLSIGLYAYKGVHLTAGLYVLLLLLAIGGLIEWQKTLAKQQVDEAL